MKTSASRGIASLAFVFLAACSSTNGDGEGSTSSSLNGGVGRVCTNDAECASGLSCRNDTDEWIAHHECTTSCENDADCTGRFGDRTMCIGAHVCVSKCLDDKDCPASTRCSENGWCAHDGPGSGVPQCGGVPIGCESLSDSECATTLGCKVAGTCEGSSFGCYGEGEGSCESLLGCYWNIGLNSCSGQALSCNTFHTDGRCAQMGGCYWKSHCTGTPSAKTCESQGATLCKYTAGCSLTAP